jgi:RNA polymerase-binding transcription factor DksA
VTERLPSTRLSEAQARTAQNRLSKERDATEQRIAALTRELNSLLETATTSDDEHDPEGATLAFERAQTQSLLSQARDELDDLDHAEQRLRDGTYGICERCGRPISQQRLAALPVARICIRCANRRH